jgi:hypothetical protein
MRLRRDSKCAAEQPAKFSHACGRVILSLWLHASTSTRSVATTASLLRDEARAKYVMSYLSE